MPVVTINPDKYERFELKTARKDPTIEGDEDGYVMLRPLPYGEKGKIRDKSTKMFMRTATQKRERGKMRTTREEDAVMEFETATELQNHLQFAYCIGEHNLLDHAHNLIDFTNPMSLKLLDPKVGSELEILIDDLNLGEDEETFEDFQKRLSGSSGATKTSDSDSKEVTETTLAQT